MKTESSIAEMQTDNEILSGRVGRNNLSSVSWVFLSICSGFRGGRKMGTVQVHLKMG